MFLLASLILITSLLCVALTIATQPDMIFHKFRAWAETKQDKWWAEPLILCIWCMASFQSTLAYGIAWGMGLIEHISWSLLWMWPVVIGGASILNGLIWNHLRLTMKKIEYFDAMEEEHFMNQVLEDEDYGDPNDISIDHDDISYHKSKYN